MDITPFQPQKLLLHRSRVEASLRGELTFPISVEIDLSNVCPHDCPFCSFGTSASGGYRQQNWLTFPYPRILDLLGELKDCGVESVTFTGGGEPLVHPEVAKIFSVATFVGLKWGLVTNGLLLPRVESQLGGATFLRVSLDAGSAETHAFTHGLPKGAPLQYHKILSNLRRVRDLNRHLMIGVSFCAMDQNYKEIYAAGRDVRDAGADYLEVRPTFPTDWRGDGWGNALSDPDAAKVEVDHARLHLEGEGFRVIGMNSRFDSVLFARAPKPYSECRIGGLTTVIGADGRMWHCCVQRGQKFFELQSVADQSFRAAWTKVWETRKAQKIDVTQCPRCRYDGYNELIEKAFIADGMHASFV